MKNLLLKTAYVLLITFAIKFSTVCMGNVLLNDFNSEKNTTLLGKFKNNPTAENLRPLLNLLDLIKESFADDVLTAQNLLQAEIDLIIKKNPEKFKEFENTRLKHYQNKISEYKSTPKYRKISDETKRIEKLDKSLNAQEKIDQEHLKIDKELIEANNLLKDLQSQVKTAINLKAEKSSSVGIENIEQENKQLTLNNKKLQDEINKLELEIRNFSKKNIKKK